MCIYTSAQTVTLVWIQVITASFTQTKIFGFIFQGNGYARRSILQDSDTYMTYYYKDAQTMYEFFLRGLRVSSKSTSCLPQVVKILKSPVVHLKTKFCHHV